MGKEVDQRIVEMRFDNKQFEDNVKTTMSTLDKLKKALHLDGASKGLEDVGSAAKKVDMSGLSNATETLRVKFSALEVIGVTALTNITNSAVNAGKQLVKSLSVDQIISGYSKYEQETANVQTLMNSTGKSVDEVNAYLEKLMWFSDETSYGFTDMTTALATMVSSGGDIEKLIPMIEGIATATAFAGKGANEFSRVIYNLNQSYGQGALTLGDWRSVELAGASSTQLKKLIIDTAGELGKLKKIQGKYFVETKQGLDEVNTGTFSSTLREKWADTAVMEKAFGKFSEYAVAVQNAVNAGQYESTAEAMAALAGKYDKLAVEAFEAAQNAKSFGEAVDATKDAVSSEWKKIFKVIFGDFEQARELWTDVCNDLWDIFVPPVQAITDLMKGTMFSGWDKIKEQVTKAGVPIEDFKSKLIDLGKKNGVVTNKMIEEAGSFEKSLKSGWLSGKMVSDALKSYTVMAKKASNATSGQKVSNEALSKAQLKNIGFTEEQIKAIRELAEEAEKTGTPIEELIASMEKPSGRELLIDTLRNVLNGIKGIVMATSEAMGTISSSKLYAFLERMNELSKKLILIDSETEELNEKGKKIVRTLSGIKAAIDIICELINGAFKVALKLVSRLFGETNIDILETTASVGDAIVAFKEWIDEHDILDRAIDKLSNFLGPIADKIKDLTDKTYNFIKEFFKLKDASDKATAFGIVVEKVGKAMNFVLSNISSGVSGLKKILDKSFGWFIIGVKHMGDIVEKVKTKISDSFTLENIGNGASILNMATFSSILISIKKYISEVTEVVGEGKGLVDGVKETLMSMKGVFEAYQKDIQAGTLLKIAAAIAILVASIVTLTFVDAEKLRTATGALATLFGELLLSMYILDEITSGSKKNKNIKTFARSMISMSVGVLILSFALKKLSEIPFLDLTKGVIAIGALMALLVGFVELMGESQGNIKKASSGIITLSIGLLLLTLSVERLGKLSLKELAKGIIGITAILVSLCAFMELAGNNSVKNAGGILILSIALTILSGAMKIFATMSWSDIARSIVVLGGSLIILAAAMNVMQNAIPGALAMLIVSPAIVILAAALKILSSLSWDEIGKGLLALGGSLLILAIGLSAMIGALPGAVAMLVVAPALLMMSAALKIFGNMSLKEIGKGLLTLAGIFLTLGVAGLVLTPLVPVLLALGVAITLIGVGVLAAAAGVMAFSVAIVTLSASIGLIPLVVNTLVTSIVGLIPLVASKIAEGITVFVSSIGRSIPTICEAVTKVALAILDVIDKCIPKVIEVAFKLLLAILTTLRDNIKKITEVAIDIVLAFAKGVGNKIGVIIDSAYKLIIKFINGLADAIRNNYQGIYNAAKNLISALFEAMFGFVKNAASDFKKLGGNIIDGLKNGIKKSLSKIKDSAKEIGGALLDGVKGILDIHSPSKKFEEIGMYSDKGLSEGLKKYAGLVVGSAKQVASDAMTSIKGGLVRLSDMVTDSIDGDPTIRPVLDLSDVESGARRINGMFSRDQALALAGGGTIGGQNGNGSIVVNMTVNGAPGQDVRQLADLVSERINNSIKRRDNRWR